MRTAIRAKNLSKTYKNAKAIDNISFEVEQGEIIGLVGKNGAGKTTLIRLLTGLAQPTCGHVELPCEQRLDTDVAAIVESPAVYPSMTAAENVETQSILLGINANKEYIAQTLQLVGLNPTDKKKAKNFSLGMKQRLAIAMALVGKPRLLLLDEPTNGLDPQGIHDMREIFLQINKLGTTLLVSSHILSELQKFATRFLFLDKGKLIADVKADEIARLAEKRICLTVDDVSKAVETLQPFGKTEILSENKVEFYGDLAPTQVLLTLAQNGVSATGMTQIGNDLEDYFVELIKNNASDGGKND